MNISLSVPPQRPATSLRLTLILPFVLLIALLTAALAGLGYWTSTKTVASMSRQVMQEKAERIAQAVDRHVYGSGAVLEAAFPEGMPAPANIADDLRALITRFWTATTLHTRPNDYVYYGNVAGQAIGLKRKAADNAQLRLKTMPEEQRKYYSMDQIGGQPVFEATEASFFDPRERPWFVLAQRAKSHTWTAVYIDFGIRDLVVTRARRVLSPEGDFAGVVATDVSLSALNEFVSGMELSPGGRAFIVQPGGELIAASSVGNVRQLEGGKFERVSASSSSDPLIDAVYQRLAPTFAAQAQRQQQVHTQVLEDHEGRSVLVAYRRIVDAAGLDWIAVVALPQSDLLTGVYQDMVVVVVLGILFLLLATMIGTRIFGDVVNDMRALTLAVRRVGQGDTDVPLQIARRDEIGELAQNFLHMRHSLFTDPLTGASNRSALQHQLARLTRPLPGADHGAPFALLFIDLNRFKPLNDRWGHDNGDLALKEVTARLRDLLRSDDMVARLGGDEFVLVLRGVDDAAQVQTVCDKIDAALQQPLTTLQGLPAEELVTVGACIGRAQYPLDAHDAQTLLKQADQDMYRNKGPSQR